MDVSIILVNYNTTRLLLQAIDSIYEKSAGFTFEVIVVDNNSSENPEKEIREKYGDQITLISLSENIGFGKANNEGIKVLDTALAEEEYSIALPKDNTALLDEINKALQTLKENGTYDKIYAKYFNK